MLTISHGHRRGFLKIGTAAFGGLTLANLLEARAASGGSFLRDRAVVNVVEVSLLVDVPLFYAVQ